MPVSSGRWPSNSVNASNPPADAPTPTMGGTLPSGMETGLRAAVEVFPAGAVRRFGRDESGTRGEGAASSGRPLPVFFVTRDPHLSRRSESASGKVEHAACHSRTWICAAGLASRLAPSELQRRLGLARRRGGHPTTRSIGSGTFEQIFDGLADLHELIQTGRLGDKLRNSQVFEQGLVPPGAGRTPHAHGNTAEVSGAADLVQDVFAGVLGQVQVHQDEAWNGHIRIGPLPADESEGLASAQQVDQFKLEVLPMERPFKKEDVRCVVFNDQDSGGGNSRNVFQDLLPAAKHGQPIFIIPQSIVPHGGIPQGPIAKGGWPSGYRGRIPSAYATIRRFAFRPRLWPHHSAPEFARPTDPSYRQWFPSRHR